MLMYTAQSPILHQTPLLENKKRPNRRLGLFTKNYLLNAFDFRNQVLQYFLCVAEEH